MPPWFKWTHPFGERGNLVSVRGPSCSKRSLTMPTKCNSHQQYSAVFQHLYHGLSPFLHNVFYYFWQGWSNYHPQSTATTSRFYLEYRKDFNSYKHDNFTAVYMRNNANYTDITQIYIHSVQATEITVENSLFIILLPSCITSKTFRLKL